MGIFMGELLVSGRVVGEVFHKGVFFKVMIFRNMEILLPTKIWLMFLITFDLQELHVNQV